MALTNESIVKGKSSLESIKSDLAKLTSCVNDLNRYIRTDSNYNKFVSGTRVGSEQRQKMDTILGILNNNLTQQTNNLISNLNDFFTVQETLNKNL